MCHVGSRQAEPLGRGLQRVDRGARPLQHVTGQAEEPAAAFGLDHLGDREPEPGQALDQVGALARIGDPGGRQRREVRGIGHPPKCAGMGD
ncbi:hypothetical protein MSAS_11610 [Mycobacterium saskatchewanense]|uniref:Uncharacterized protein n=1 Tax=Mycobacterium saskatchewanense TaxID=220927 RepID=A0AAJ3NUA3_9MYCO|nr:hypothetical protein AWC23_00035 [Mycobacterium saskatchewanense]BBX61987.1 hypothetical protein MSAS_11610 [Mycobacterium saskatchewanense]